MSAAVLFTAILIFVKSIAVLAYMMAGRGLLNEWESLDRTYQAGGPAAVIRKAENAQSEIEAAGRTIKAAAHVDATAYLVIQDFAKNDLKRKRTSKSLFPFSIDDLKNRILAVSLLNLGLLVACGIGILMRNAPSRYLAILLAVMAILGGLNLLRLENIGTAAAWTNCSIGVVMAILLFLPETAAHFDDRSGRTRRTESGRRRARR